MGRYISCGIATEIIVLSKGSLKEHKNDIIKRIDKIFNLKYYEVESSDNYIFLCLKQDLFNKAFKNLLLELTELNLFTDSFYENIKAIDKNYCTSKERKKAVCDYLEKHFDLKIEKKYEETYDYEKGKKIVDKDNFKYCIDDFLELSDEIELHSENYLYCTDMSDETQFNDGMTNLNGFYMFLNHIPLYSDFNKTDSEDITFTLRFLNHFIRKSLKSELKSTLIFGLTD